MSYDIYLLEPGTKETIQFYAKHDLKGGTFCKGGTTEAWLNVTYNYSEHFHKVLGKDGIRSIYGKAGAATVPILEAAIAQLKDDVDPDYWKSTEGNVKEALKALLWMAKQRPDGVWKGD